jgi:hypothetical protein
MNAASKRIGACGSAAASCARHLECARLKLQIHVEVEIETSVHDVLDAWSTLHHRILKPAV